MKKDSSLLFPTINGNEQLKTRLASDILNNSLFHSILITGEKGCGKKLFAYQIAAAIACENRYDDCSPLPCGKCSSCKKILDGNSLDVIFIDKEDHETIGVDYVREFRRDAVISSNELNFKVYIINDFHTMTVQAQNAALKIFEEPPKGVYFILLAENVQNILDTIISRVIQFNIRPFSKSEIRKYIFETPEFEYITKNLPAEKIDEILKYSRGSIGRVKIILNAKDDEYKKAIEEYRIPEKLIRLLTGMGKKLETIDQLRSLPNDRTELSVFFSDMALAARDIISYKGNHNTDLMYYISLTSVEEAAASIPIRRAFRIAESALDIKKYVAKNVNVQLIKDRYMLDLIKIFNS